VALKDIPGNMIKSKTLFIVGAGASKEVGLPTGAELKTKIASTIDIRFQHGFEQTTGDYVVTEALRRHTHDPTTNRSGNISPFLHAARMVRDALPQALSIDNFIDAHRDDEKIALVGKLGIVRCILEAERSSRISLNDRNIEKLDFSSLTETWFSAFFQLVTETVSKAEIARVFENVSFITFNYDRCIEHFLVHALKNYYGIDDGAAQELVQKVPIIHPYGQVGYLPWQSGTTKMAFGGNGTERGDELLAVSTQVKTFTERIEDEAALQAMRHCVQEAETIVFLGFAYHPTNLELIAPHEKSKAKRIFGTAKGMSDSDAKAVTDDLPSWLKKERSRVDIELRNELTCAKLFAEFWRSIPRPVG
jgi:hypothetical protein